MECFLPLQQYFSASSTWVGYHIKFIIQLLEWFLPLQHESDIVSSSLFNYWSVFYLFNKSRILYQAHYSIIQVFSASSTWVGYCIKFIIQLLECFLPLQQESDNISSSLFNYWSVFCLFNKSLILYHVHYSIIGVISASSTSWRGVYTRWNFANVTTSSTVNVREI